MILDTHIFLWWLFEDTRLPAKIMGYIQVLDFGKTDENLLESNS